MTHHSPIFLILLALSVILAPGFATAASDFTMAASPADLTVEKGSSGTSTITLASPGAAIEVTLSAGVGPLPQAPCPPVCFIPPEASVNPGLVSLPASGTGTSTLTVFSDEFTTPGTYPVWVMGTTSDAFHMRELNVTITDSSSLRVEDVETFAGVKVTTTGTLSIDLTTRTVSGTVTVTAADEATGQFLFSKTYSISNIPFNNNQAMFLLNVAVTPYPLASALWIAASANSLATPVSVSRNFDVNRDEVVNIADLAIGASAFGSTTGGSRFEPRVDFNADGCVDIRDLAWAALYFGTPNFT